MAKGRIVALRKIVVEGKCRFPFDMLRRDSCYPVSSADVSSILLEPGDPGYLETRRITLITASSRTEPDRWKSFQWQIISEEAAI